MKRGLRSQTNSIGDSCNQEYKEQMAKEIDNAIIEALNNAIKEFVKSNSYKELATVMYSALGMGISCDLLNDIHDYINNTYEEINNG